MSLKAKIEAVIYASEEPVTLAQLTGLLGEEGQAELEALAAQQHSLALEDEEADDSAIADPDIEPIEDADALNAEIIVPATEVGAPEPALSSSKGLASETWEASPASPNQPPSPATEEVATSNAKALAADQKLAARKLRDYFRSLLDELIADYANGNRGLEIREVAGGFRLATKPEYHDARPRLRQIPQAPAKAHPPGPRNPRRRRLQAARHTAPEVSEIRGVDSAGVLGSLLTRKLVTTAGRKQVIGRPILYKTTKDFLLRFGLKDINELPSIEEFEKMAGELNETLLDQASEPEAQEEIQMEHPPEPGSEPASDTSEETISNLAELEGHNLQPALDAPTSEPESISEEIEPSEVEPSAGLHSPQADGEPEDEDPEIPEA